MISTLLNIVKVHQILNSDLAKKVIAWVKARERDEQIMLVVLALLAVGTVLFL